MKVHKLLLLFVLLLCSIPLGATSYYLSPTGSDSNSGMTPAAAWLSPNHAVNCGDTIIAAASNSYSYANFGFGKWGTVNCAAGNNVAWLTCATFDACKINFSASLQPGMEVSASYWGVQGWEIDGTKATGPCFEAWPWTTWNHIIFANNIANGCGLSGFSTSNSGSANSIDYIAIVGNIAYNSAGGTYYCGSGISVYEPIASDSLPGTHIYIAGNFSYANFDGACSGSGATDGEGINLDTFDGSQGGTPLYTQQTVVDNNILIGNGGPGLELFNNYQGSGSPGPVYFRHNTMWGNNANPIELVPAYAVGELLLYQGYNATVTREHCHDERHERGPLAAHLRVLGQPRERHRCGESKLGLCGERKHFKHLQLTGLFIWVHQRVWYGSEFCQSCGSRCAELRWFRQRSGVHGDGDRKLYAASVRGCSLWLPASFVEPGV